MTVTILESEGERNPLDFESVSKAEFEVFGLIPELCPTLNFAFCRYMRMVGYYACTDELEEDQKKADAEKFGPTLKNWPGADPAHNANLCALFMHNHCGIPFDQGYAWHRRVEAQEWRQGLKRVHAVTVSDAYQARMGDKANKLTTVALIRKDGTTSMIDANDVEF